MSSLWRLANIDELEFAATATLLALTAKQQSLVTAEEMQSQIRDESDSEFDEEEEYATTESTATLSTYPPTAFVDKFLNRLAEALSREKSRDQHGGRQSSKHVAAAAWISPGNKSPLTIILAKNGGLDDRDRSMATQLQLWFRTIAVTGRPSEVSVDKIWIGDKGLVEYSRGRLWHHISQINQLGQRLNILAAQSHPHGDTIACLQRLCRDVTAEATTWQLSRIVDTAYEIRNGLRDLRANVADKKALRSINMLGRLRAAYECFKSVALTFEGMSTMEMKPLSLHQPTEVNLRLFRKLLQRRLDDFGLSKSLLTANAARKFKAASQLHSHAEMQTLMVLVGKTDWNQRTHRYIGTSKKPCFLCFHILQNYTGICMEGDRKPVFRTRMSHGKVYPLWTLPRSETLPPVVCIAIAAALTQVYHQIQQHLQHGIASQLAIAESSAGVTDSALTADGTTAMKMQYVSEQRSSNSSKMREGSEEPKSLGRKIKSVRVGLLPADGSKPRLVPINFHALPVKEDRRLPECGHDLVPDFYDSWGGWQFDRQFRILTLTHQATRDLEGDFRLYWNENPDLPENENIKSLLGIEKTDAVRQLWYGDIFIVRFSEQAGTFAYDVHDAPTAILQCQHLSAIFQDMWKSQYLEAKKESDRSFEASQEKIEADKEIIFQRMTPMEQEIFSRLPPGTLEYLAITSCDDGALGDVSIDKVPHDPSLVQITTMTRKTALDSIGWDAFHGCHL